MRIIKVLQYINAYKVKKASLEQEESFCLAKLLIKLDLFERMLLFISSYLCTETYNAFEVIESNINIVIRAGEPALVTFLDQINLIKRSSIVGYCRLNLRIQIFCVWQDK